MKSHVQGMGGGEGFLYSQVPCPEVRGGVFLHSEIPCLGGTGRGGICTVRSPVWGKGVRARLEGPCTVRSHVRGAGVGEDQCMVRSNASWVMVTSDPPLNRHN